MSRQWQPSLREQVPQMSTPDANRPEPDTPSLDEAVYRCTCGIPEASGNWICCDGEKCPVGWYHWECVWVTEEPSGDWLCPNCRPKPTKDAELLRQPQGARRPIFPKLGKTAAELQDTWNLENESGQAVADKAPVRAKKGVAVKKVTPKKAKSKWVGWVELTSEDEEEQKKSVEAAQIAVSVIGGRRARAPMTPSKGRLTRSRTLKGSSNVAAKAKRKTRMEAAEEDINEVDSNDFLEIDGKRDESVQESNLGLSNGRKEGSGNTTDESDMDLVDIPEGSMQRADRRNPYDSHQSNEPIPRPPNPTPTNTISAPNPPPAIPTEAANPTTPAISSRVPNVPPSAPPDQDSTLGLTVRHPSEVPSAPPASGAAMVIDTEEQGWTAVITSVAPDGSSSVDYWSYRTNTWCTIPLSAIRSTLPF